MTGVQTCALPIFENALPSDPVSAIRNLTEREQELETLRYELVKQARRDGYSWEIIAAALGISRQSAWQYYAPRILDEFDREENYAPGLSGSEADGIAVSETRAVRRRRRSNSA